jgi:hypothetical protein
MRKALLSAAVVLCGATGGLFAGSAQATQVGFSVNIHAPLGNGVVVGTSVFGGVPIVTHQPVVFVSRPVIVAPAPVVVVPLRGFGHRHRHYGHRHFHHHRHGRGGYRY